MNEEYLLVLGAFVGTKKLQLNIAKNINTPEGILEYLINSSDNKDIVKFAKRTLLKKRVIN